MTGPRAVSSHIPITPILAVLLALFAASALYFTGGFAAAQKQVPRLRPGQTLDQAWFDMTPLEAVAKGKHLDIHVKVTNKGEETARLNEDWAKSIIRVAPGLAADKGAWPKVFTPDPTTVSTGPTNNQLHPGVPKSVVVRYPLPGLIPSEVAMDLGGFEWREDFFGVGERWVPLSDESSRPFAVARVALPVRQVIE